MGRPFRGDPHTLSCTGLSSMAIQPRPKALGHSHLSDFVLGYSHCELCVILFSGNMKGD